MCRPGARVPLTKVPLGSLERALRYFHEKRSGRTGWGCRQIRHTGLTCPAPYGRLVLRGEQAAVECLGDGGRPVADAELGVDVVQVGLHRGLADEQPRRRLPVRAPAGHQLEHLELALAEPAGVRLADLIRGIGRLA